MISYVTHRVAFYQRSCAKKWASPFDLAGVLHRSALAQTTRCLCTKKWVNPFHLQVFCNMFWSLDQKKWASPFHSGGVLHLLHLSRWLCPRCACAQNNGRTHFTPDVFCMNSFPVQHRSYMTPRHLAVRLICSQFNYKVDMDQIQSSQSLTGGFRSL